MVNVKYTLIAKVLLENTVYTEPLGPFLHVRPEISQTTIRAQFS